VRITIFIDNDILKFFKARAAKRGKPAYQTQINQALREYMEGSRPPTKGSQDERRLIAHLAEQVAQYAIARSSKGRPEGRKR
jgi:hypothetical protein